MDTQRFFRGQMWWYKPEDKLEDKNAIQVGARPCIILSNDTANRFSSVILAAPCTSQDKSDLPTHVTYDYKGIKNTVLLEQAGPINTYTLVGYCCTLDKEVMDQIDKALMVAFGISLSKAPKKSEIWTKTNKQKLIEMVDEGKLLEAEEKFHLKQKTIELYYKKFSKELNFQTELDLKVVGK